MGPGTDDRPGAARALVGASDIARLTGVRRPAVSNWRRRFGDFPGPVAGTSTHPLFALDEVQAWCREHDKAFEADTADLLWQGVRAVVPDVRRTEFTAYVGDVLVNGSTDEVPPQSWTELADRVLGHEEPWQAFEELCSRLTRERGRAETAPDLAAWMADLAEAGPEDRVLDPACGLGTLLLAAVARGAATVLFQDRDPYCLKIAAARLVETAPAGRAVPGDTLRAPAHVPQHADIAVCDPPFRDRAWGYEELSDDPRWVYGFPPRGEGELAWVQHCLDRVRPGGRVVVLLPASVSYRPGGRRIRANLLRSGALRAVLEVPGDGGGEAGRHVWVLTRPREDADTRGRVLLVSAADADESARACREFLHGLSVQDGTHQLAADVTELMDDEVDLRPSRHVAEVRKEQAAAHYQPLLAELADALKQARSLAGDLELSPTGGVPTTTVGALLDEGAVELHRAPMAMDTEAGDLPVLTVRDVRTGREAGGRCDRVPGLVMMRTGDVVVAETVREAPVRVVTEPGVVLGPRLLLLRPVAARIDPDFLAGSLEPESVSSARTSSGRVDVRSLRLPELSLDEQRAHALVRVRLSRNRQMLERIAELGARLAESGHRGLREGALSPPEAESQERLSPETGVRGLEA